jgi:hypothetical protein
MANWVINLGRKGGVENFAGSMERGIWGMNSASGEAKGFLNKVKPGDRLWFSVPSEKGWTHQWHATAVITSPPTKRVLGPLVALSASDEELGWGGAYKGTWDIELYFADMEIMPMPRSTFTCCRLITVRRGDAPSLSEVNYDDLLKEIVTAQEAQRVAADAIRVAAAPAALMPGRMRDMRKCIRDGQRVRHIHTDEVWTATYNWALNQLVHAGVEYKSPCDLAKAHQRSNPDSRFRNADGWIECELETAPGVWGRMMNLPEIVVA